MGDHLYQRFPEKAESIQAFRAKDATFGEVCADYETISAWLATHDCPETLDLENLADARELKRALEDEILELLEEHHETSR